MERAAFALEDRLKTIFHFLGRTATAFLATVGVLAAFGLLIGLMEQRTQRLLLSAFGWMGVVVTGLVGTPVHAPLPAHADEA